MLTREDEQELQGLYVEYNRAIDANDALAWAGTFTEDGVFVDGSLRLEGHAELQSFAAGRAQRLASQGVARKQHWVSNIRLEGNSDLAHGTCYLLILAELADGSGFRVDRIGAYTDEFAKVNGRWFFTTRSGG